eukprot:1408718-Pyramimonas_sp.AAC.1
MMVGQRHFGLLSGGRQRSTSSRFVNDFARAGPAGGIIIKHAASRNHHQPLLDYCKLAKPRLSMTNIVSSRRRRISTKITSTTRMCWSLELSLASSAFVAATTTTLWLRNGGSLIRIHPSTRSSLYPILKLLDHQSRRLHIQPCQRVFVVGGRLVFARSSSCARTITSSE